MNLNSKLKLVLSILMGIPNRHLYDINSQKFYFSLSKNAYKIYFPKKTWKFIRNFEWKVLFLFEDYLLI